MNYNQGDFMINKNKYTLSICHLIKLTQEGSIKWKSYIPTFIGGNSIVKGVFELFLKNGDYLRMSIYWGSKAPKLEIFYLNDKKLCEFPYTNALQDLSNILLQSIDFEINRDNILDGILNETLLPIIQKD